MKKIIALIMAVLCIAFLLCGCSPQQPLEDNWGVALPDNGEFSYYLREGKSVYGSRYSVYSYEKDKSKVAGWCVWEKDAALTEKAAVYIADLNIPPEYCTDFTDFYCWYKEQEGNELFILWQENGDIVYAIEHFSDPTA